MKRNTKRKNEGITLIALVITIIILLILAGITIGTITGNNGIINKAQNAKEETEIANEKEVVEKATTQAMGNNKLGNVEKDELEKELDEQTGEEKTEVSEIEEWFKITFKDSECSYLVDKNGNIMDIPDRTGIEVGDFVDYDAGIWSEEDINQIKTGEKGKEKSVASSSEGGSDFQFSSFTSGMSRNESPVNRTQYYDGYGEDEVENKVDTYVKEINEDGTQRSLTGWRVFDIDKNSGEITLISAGCPEIYYMTTYSSGYEHEYILTGKVNSKWSNMTEEMANNQYTKRNWDMYINQEQNAKEARILTKNDLDNWYKKNIYNEEVDTSEQDIYKSIYDTKHQTIIDNNADYWLLEVSPKNALRNYLWHMSENHCYINDYFYGTLKSGIRILVTLSFDTKLSEKPIKTKTLVNPRNVESTWTYNVWGIE